VLRARLARREHDVGIADRKRERADWRASHEGAPLNLVHQLFLPTLARRWIAAREREIQRRSDD
jgi:hypothetical protein